MGNNNSSKILISCFKILVCNPFIYAKKDKYPIQSSQSYYHDDDTDDETYLLQVWERE